MPGIICSLSDLVEELDNFVWLHRLSDALDQQLRYSYPAHRTHKLLRDSRYMAGHQSNSEDSENFLIRLLENGGHATQRWSPPFVGVLPWLLDLPEEDRFGVLSDMSVGHIDILITEFCRKERLDGSATARLRQQLAYDSVPHEVYQVIRMNSGPRPNLMVERLYESGEGEKDDDGPEQQSLDAPSCRSVLLKPRSGDIAKPPRAYRKRGPKARAAQFKQRYISSKASQERGDRRGPSSVESCVQSTGVPDDGSQLFARVKSETPERSPRRVWWERVDSHGG
ncbi:hypothetical protein FOZ63_008209 [Perkinsus olseni]|uniref:Uncharacterized protein n=1 Tax=Perkinsus olseni TaxID=32597 RepID=A0A7J6SES1_PEROL|nr:hypothetical protein FOZ63_008209 [Perkinsus olseni]